MWKLALVILFAISCGSSKVTFREKRNTYQEDLDRLKNEVYGMVGTINQINSFVANDFADCDNGLPPFETKMCQIAQTAVAEQLVIFTSQLRDFTKIMQTTLYGEDCREIVESGCPAPGSIIYSLTELEDRVTTLESQVEVLTSDVATLETEIVSLQATVTTMQGDITSLTNRLNNFNGSGQSIEVVINNMETLLSSLDSRLDDIEDQLAGGDVYKIVTICSNIVNSGPIYEALLVTGDNKKVVAYLEAGNSAQRGLAMIAEAGVSGHQYLQTTLNTATCKFKIYDLGSQARVCWDKTNRNASQANIDSKCDASNGLANPSADCTCAN
jgi:uncharacterized coiled-coil protein SlyX